MAIGTCLVAKDSSMQITPAVYSQQSRSPINVKSTH